MKLTKVHRGKKFSGLPFQMEYIKNNTEVRYANRSDEKNFYKLMNNAPYGKTIENVAKSSDIWHLVDEAKAGKIAEKPHCIVFTIFSENLFGFELRKTKSLINKPFHVCSHDVKFGIFIVLRSLLDLLFYY